jgi:RND family efflux transporter MFP subunit
MNRRNSQRNVSIAVSTMSLALVAALSGCSSEQPTHAAAGETVSGVTVIVAQEKTVPDWLEAVGTVEAAQTSELASQMMGTIVQIDGREGDRVRAGQVLATIDDSQPRAAVEQSTAAVSAAKNEAIAANSQFALAEATFARYRQLYKEKSVSPQEFDEINAQYQSAGARRDMANAGEAQANAALTQARTSLSYTQIRAPFNGIITAKKADVGTLAAPGMPIFTIEDTRHYRLEATVDESNIGLVHLGQPVPVTLDALGNAILAGRVAQLVPAADPASRSFIVKIELPANPGVQSGLFGRARFARGQRSALLVPSTAAVERGQLRGVYALDPNDIAELRYVTLGNTSGAEVEVLSGLQPGEKLVADPGARDFSGKRILAQP